MTDVTIVGCGNLGSALVAGLSQSGGHDVTAYDVDEAALERVAPHVARTTTDVETASASDVVTVAVKPDVVGAVLDEFDLSSDQTLVTVAAGVSRAYVRERTDATVVRVMPNLAAETRDMAAAVTWDDPDEGVREMLADLGSYVEIEEELMDAATALNGSGPAFVFYTIQAMTEGAVAEGMDEADAETLAAQTVKGAAETVLRSDRSVEELIDAVCSPNGTTVEGMEVLWDSDFADTMGAALAAATRRSRELAAERADE
ncbi:MAG: pyrroline-5-carboxylate reductase [Haloferacaceae archaeon]